MIESMRIQPVSRKGWLKNTTADFYCSENTDHFKCPWRDIIRGEESVIPAKRCWAKITNP